MALRLLAGVFVVGWVPRFVDAAKELKEGRYALKLFGDMGIADSSDVIAGKLARPAVPLILYEYEASPFCRKVREALGILDLACELRPCPGARSGFSEQLFQRTGRRTVPYFIDPNTVTEMFESDDIIKYLFKNYGPGEDAVPFSLQGGYAAVSAGLASVVTGMAGARPDARARPDNIKRKPLELWGYEASPFVKLVRARLCSLMLPHVIVNCARGSAKREALIVRTGRFQVPFLADPNTGIEMFESPEICEYLDKVYTQ